MISSDDIQLLLTLVLFLLSWLVLWLFARLLVDYDAAERWLNEETWLKLLAPRFRFLLVKWGWQLIVAATIAIGAHGYLGGAASYLKLACDAPPIFSAPPSRWLPPDMESLPTVGREDEIKQLHTFTSSSTAFSWWWFLGEDDVGLRRATKAWLEELPTGAPCTSTGFDAGFLRYDVPTGFWREFRPRRQTAIVIEDSGERVEQVRELVGGLGARHTELAHPVRVLLIDRHVPTKLHDLDFHRLYSPFRFKEPLELPPLGATELQNLAQEIGRVKGILPQVNSALMNELALNAGGQEWLAITALAGATESPGQLIYPRELLSTQYQRLQAQLRRDGLPGRCSELLALATLTNGLNWETARRVSPEEEGCLNRVTYDNVLRQSTENGIPPIRPQLLGGYFVLETLATITPAQQRFLIDTAWETDPDSTLWSIVWANVDHPDHHQLRTLNARPATENLLEAWARFLVAASGIPRIDKARRDKHLDQLRALNGEFPNRPNIRRMLASGLTAMTYAISKTERPITQASESMTPIWSELTELAREQRTDPDIQASLAMASINVFAYYGRGLNELRKLEKQTIPTGRSEIVYETEGRRLQIHMRLYDVWNDLVKAYQTDRGDPVLREYFAKGIVNVIDAYRGISDMVGVDPLLTTVTEVIFDFEEKYPDEPQIQLRCARSLINLFTIYDEIAPDLLPNAWSALQRIAERFPQNLELQREKAIGAQNLAFFFGKQRDWARVEQVLDVLKETAEKNKTDADVKNALAWGTANAAFVYSQQIDTTSMIFSLGELIDIWAEDLNRNDAVVWSSQMLIESLGKDEKWEALTQTINELESFAARYKGVEPVEHARVKWNVIAADQYGNGGRIGDTELAWERLQDAATQFPNDPRVKIDVVHGALNTVYAYANESGSETPREVEIESIWQRVVQIAAAFPGDRDVQEAVVRAGSQSIYAFMKRSNVAKAQEVLRTLEDIAGTYPDDFVIQEITRSARELVTRWK